MADDPNHTATDHLWLHALFELTREWPPEGSQERAAYKESSIDWRTYEERLGPPDRRKAIADLAMLLRGSSPVFWAARYYLAELFDPQDGALDFRLELKPTKGHAKKRLKAKVARKSTLWVETFCRRHGCRQEEAISRLADQQNVSPRIIHERLKQERAWRREVEEFLSMKRNGL